VSGSRWIGVLDTKLQSRNYNEPDNQCGFIPYDTFSIFGDIHYPWFLVFKPVSGEATEQAVKQVRAKLAELHNMRRRTRRRSRLSPSASSCGSSTG